MTGSRPSVTTSLRSSASLPARFPLRTLVWILALLSLWLIAAPVPVRGADLDDCRKLFIAGKYEECIQETAAAIKDRKWGEGWYTQKADAELTLGKYSEAFETIAAGLKRYPSGIRLRFIGRRASLLTDNPEQAQKYLEEIDRQVSGAPWRYTDVDDLVTLGQAALVLGADARNVLDGFYERARKQAPTHRLPHLALGRLALDKHDYELAADIFQKAAKEFADDPDILFGLAEAYADSDSKRSALALGQTLEKNPNHIPALLFKVDQFIDSERYDLAREWLTRIETINPRQIQVWVYRAVLAHVSNDPRGETAFRSLALASWQQNPEVDHLIGKKLSQKYRFAEGAAYQRSALSMRADYLPARVQLSQDLLRLGEEEEGWQLADAAYQADGYDITTFNLLELRDAIARFKTLTNDDFIVRMDAREAEIYGERVLDLLGRAKTTLCKKYGLDLKHKITVEIFPNEDDFAVRTFGMPAVSGYLGVCFGKVITANSPASQGENPSNWQAVLWHEFCHVVTLELTRNKMPRWLSEGISVHEELQADSRWGQRMTPHYREMILDGELTPLSQLSSAFLAPSSPMHLQFAYYESALAVEFLVDRFGMDSLKNILRDLGSGLPINVSIERHTDSLGKLDQEFAQFVLERANALAPKVEWAKPDLADLLNDDTDAVGAWVKKHPHSFYGLITYAKQFLENKEWKTAIKPLETLIELYPEYTGADNAYTMLAHVYRQLEQPEKEAEILQQLVDLDADAVHSSLRLIEMGEEKQDWKFVVANAHKAIAINPLLPRSYQGLAKAAEKLNQTDEAISAYRTLLAIGPNDPAEIHYRLALLLHRKSDPAAKRHVLLALEHAPRFRAAHKLLLKITRNRGTLATKKKKARVATKSK